MNTGNNLLITVNNETTEFFTSLGEYVLEQYEDNESASNILPFVCALLHSDSCTDEVCSILP